MNHIYRLSLIVLLFLGQSFNCIAQQNLEGAWKSTFDTRTHQKVTLQAIIKNHYLVVAYYSADDGSFIRTLGGTMNYKGNDMSVLVDFDSEHPEKIGTIIHFKFIARSNKIKFTNSSESWKRVDFGNESNLSGTWQIVGRKQNDEIVPSTPNPGKTFKVLSGTRFQWIAFDAETRQFRGTGGGRYFTEGHSYTEQIDFFSRDRSQVGQDLGFEYEIVGGAWHHSGLSSSGKPIYEIWSARK